MNLAIVATALAWVTVCAGLTLALFHARRKRAPGWLVWGHPSAAVVTLVCLWVAFALWPGRVDTRFNAGVFVITIAFVAGGFMFSLRATRLPVPLLAIIMHGAVALIGCILVLVGLLMALGG